jgi:hypothetical protein
MHGEWLKSTRGLQPCRWNTDHHRHVQPACIIRRCHHWCEAAPPSLPPSMAQTCCHHRGRLHGRNPHRHCSPSDCRHSRRKRPHATFAVTEAVTPPPKRIRRRRNEVELLWGAEGEDDLLLSPLSCTSPPPLFSSPSPSRALTSSSTSPLLRPSTPLDHVPASPPTCPPTLPERPESPPPAEPATASPPKPAADPPSPPTSPLQPASRQPAPSALANSSPSSSAGQPPPSPGYTIVFKWCPNGKTSLMDSREFECYSCQDRRYYCLIEHEEE